MSETPRRKLVSGDSAILARRYGGALYELAEGEKSVDAVAADLRALRQMAEGNAEFIAVAKHPRLTRAQLVQIADSLTTSMKLNKLTGKFLALVAQQRRLAILAAIIDAFLAQLAQARGEFTAEVRTASALTPQQTEQLSARLATLAGGKVYLELHEDKSLIGGMTVQMGSRLIDASIRSKLQRLERQLKSEAA